MTVILPCNDVIYQEGKMVLMVAGKKEPVEDLVQYLTNKTGCLVDWYYVGGRAIIKTMPENVEKVVSFLNTLSNEEIVGNGITDMKRYQLEEIL